MTENTATLDSFEIQTEHRSLWVDVWRQFRKHKGALVGMFVFMLITFCVFIGPFIYDVDPNAINFRERNLGPSWSHPFPSRGNRVIQGTRTLIQFSGLYMLTSGP